MSTIKCDNTQKRQENGTFSRRLRQAGSPRGINFTNSSGSHIRLHLRSTKISYIFLVREASIRLVKICGIGSVKLLLGGGEDNQPLRLECSGTESLLIHVSSILY